DAAPAGGRGVDLRGAARRAPRPVPRTVRRRGTRAAARARGARRARPGEFAAHPVAPAAARGHPAAGRRVRPPRPRRAVAAHGGRRASARGVGAPRPRRTAAARLRGARAPAAPEGRRAAPGAPGMIAASHAPCDVLLVRLSAMGDVVHALGAMHALALVRPQWRLHVAVQSTFAPLFDHLDWLASVVPHRRHPPLRGFAHFARAARALRCSLALDLQGNWKSALAAFASGAPRRVGIAGPLRRERHSACLLTDKVAPSAPVPHPAHLALDVVRAVAPEAVATSSLLVATDEEMAREAAALRALGIDAELPFLVLVLGDP